MRILKSESRMRSSLAEGLTAKQEKALAHLRRMPVPDPPLLQKGTLLQPPWIYRLIPFSAYAAGLFLIAGVVSLPFLGIPESWGAALFLKSGRVVELSGDRTMALDLPQIKGRMILQGPTRVQVKSLHRRLLSGRREGEFALAEGQLYFEAEPISPKQVLIHTPLLTVRVTGTEFLLGHQVQQGSRLVVVQGDVEALPLGSRGEWEWVPAGMIFSVTPEGLIEREVLRKELPLDDFRLPAVGQRFGSSSGPDETPPVNLRSLLWHEE